MSNSVPRDMPARPAPQLSATSYYWDFDVAFETWPILGRLTLLPYG